MDKKNNKHFLLLYKMCLYQYIKVRKDFKYKIYGIFKKKCNM